MSKIEKPQEVIDLINRSLLAQKIGMNEEAIALIKLAIVRYLIWEKRNRGKYQFLISTPQFSPQDVIDFSVRWRIASNEIQQDLIDLEESLRLKNQNWIAIAQKYTGATK